MLRKQQLAARTAGMAAHGHDGLQAAGLHRRFSILGAPQRHCHYETEHLHMHSANTLRPVGSGAPLH